ncbi:MAG: NAD(+) synthase [Sphaerochaetaceae bacterium]
MRDGFIPVGVATPHLIVGDPSYNAQETIRIMQEGVKEGLSLLVFPELGLTAYTCQDLFLQKTLIQSALNALQEVVTASAQLPLVTIVGVPLTRRGALYNCAVVIQGGEVLAVVPKTHLFSTQESSEVRYFAPAPPKNTTIELFGKLLPFGTKLLFKAQEVENFIFAVEICNDLWGQSPPSNHHSRAGALIIANLSASSELVGKGAYRRSLVKGQSARLFCGYLYASAGSGESSSEMVYLGHNLISENGEILAESKIPFEGILKSEIDVAYLAGERRSNDDFSPIPAEEYLTVEFSCREREVRLTRLINAYPFIPVSQAQRRDNFQTALLIQAMALVRRVQHVGCEKVVLGLSGGLDSTLALIVAIEAYERLKKPLSGIIAVTMPCFGTTATSLKLAEDLAEHFGVTLRKIDITKAVEQHFLDIGHAKEVHDITYENAQARERTQVLMDVANSEGAIVIGTGDLSELALGWATYNGDLMSMYGLNASVPKTLVRHLINYYAHERAKSTLKMTLLKVLEAPVSPELLPPKEGETTQKTEEVIGPYELSDFFLFHSIRRGCQPRKVYRLAKIAFEGKYSEQEILSWLRLFYKRFFANQFKRSTLPEGPMIGSLSLNPRSSWKMPSDASVKIWLDELE